MARKKTVVRKLVVSLRAKEEAVIKAIEEDGFDVSDIVRGMIRDYGADHYPEEKLYAKVAAERARIAAAKLAEQNMSPEEYAVKKMRARIIKGTAWIMDPGGYPYEIPLNEVKDMDLKHNWLQQYWDTLDLKPFKPMGKVLQTEEMLKKKREEWEKKLKMIEES